MEASSLSEMTTYEADIVSIVFGIDYDKNRIKMMRNLTMKENIIFEEFARAGRHPDYVFEGKMARAYRTAVDELRSAREGSGDSLPRIEDAQKRLAEIESDISNFIDIVGGYSRHDIAEKLNRSKLDIDRAKRKARNILKRAKLENPDLSLDNVEKLEVVQTAYKERDRIIAGLKPIVAELNEKIERAVKVLEKYG